MSRAQQRFLLHHGRAERGESDDHVRIYGSRDREENWHALLAWRKDHWPMSFFQYGNAFFPDGDNKTITWR